MSLEEQLRNEAQSLREIKWFNLAGMMTAAADEIHRLNENIKRLEEAGDAMADLLEGKAITWNKAKDTKP